MLRLAVATLIRHLAACSAAEVRKGAVDVGDDVDRGSVGTHRDRCRRVKGSTGEIDAPVTRVVGEAAREGMFDRGPRAHLEPDQGSEDDKDEDNDRQSSQPGPPRKKLKRIERALE
jgi:hypothetical protein